MSELNKNLQSINPNPIIELYEIELKTALHGANTTYRFHNNTNITTAQGNIIWNSNTYYSHQYRQVVLNMKPNKLPDRHLL